MFLDPLNLVHAGGWAKYQISEMTHDNLDVRKIGPKLWEMRGGKVVIVPSTLKPGDVAWASSPTVPSVSGSPVTIPQPLGCLFRWEWDLGECALLIPSGYRSDGASVPKPYRNIVDPEAAFDWSWPHDIIYEAHGGDRPFKVWNDDGTFRLETLTDALTGMPLTVDRCRADALLFCGWVSEGMKRLEAVAGYDALRQFGTQAWESKV